MQSQSNSEKERLFRKALRRVLEGATYVLQKKNKHTGRWTTEPWARAIAGRAAAHALLNATKARDPFGYEWRVVQKLEADKYQEGWDAAARYYEGDYVPDDEGGMRESA